jgi:sulfopropanediol 3-dehydrogenase
MIRYLKRGVSEAEKFEADRNVRQTVEAILDDVVQRGDVAVRELSAKFDNWQPQDFRLSSAQIQALIDSLPAQVIDDIGFAQAQIRRFAEVQRAALRMSRWRRFLAFVSVTGIFRWPASAAMCQAAAIRWWRPRI